MKIHKARQSASLVFILVRNVLFTNLLIFAFIFLLKFVTGSTSRSGEYYPASGFSTESFESFLLIYLLLSFIFSGGVAIMTLLDELPKKLHIDKKEFERKTRLLFFAPAWFLLSVPLFMGGGWMLANETHTLQPYFIGIIIGSLLGMAILYVNFIRNKKRFTNEQKTNANKSMAITSYVYFFITISGGYFVLNIFFEQHSSLLSTLMGIAGALVFFVIINYFLSALLRKE